MENSQQLMDITLPLELSSGALTLEEIGTIVVLMSISHQYLEYWRSDVMFNHHLANLMEEDIVVMNDDNLLIDLTWI